MVQRTQVFVNFCYKKYYQTSLTSTSLKDRMQNNRCENLELFRFKLLYYK